jgi:hypothetical protein
MAVIVAALGLAGSRAEASCGDWLEGHAESRAAADHPDAREAAGMNGRPDASASAPVSRRPCRGPSCGRRPGPPLAPTNSPSVSLDVERDAVLAAAVAVPDVSLVAWFSPDELFSPSAGRDPAERPPARG